MPAVRGDTLDDAFPPAALRSGLWVVAEHNGANFDGLPWIGWSRGFGNGWLGSCTLSGIGQGRRWAGCHGHQDLGQPVVELFLDQWHQALACHEYFQLGQALTRPKASGVSARPIFKPRLAAALWAASRSVVSMTAARGLPSLSSPRNMDSGFAIQDTLLFFSGWPKVSRSKTHGPFRRSIWLRGKTGKLDRGG